MRRPMLRPDSICVQNTKTNISHGKISLTVLIAVTVVMFVGGCTQMYTSNLNELLEKPEPRGLQNRVIDRDKFTIDPNLSAQSSTEQPANQAEMIGVTENMGSDAIRRIPSAFDESSVVVDQSAFETPLTTKALSRLAERRQGKKQSGRLTDSTRVESAQESSSSTSANQSSVGRIVQSSAGSDPTLSVKPSTPDPIVLKAEPAEPAVRDENDFSVTPLPPQNDQVNPATWNSSHAKLKLNSSPLAPMAPAAVAADSVSLGAVQIARSRILQPVVTSTVDDVPVNDHEDPPTDTTDGDNLDFPECNEFQPSNDFQITVQPGSFQVQSDPAAEVGVEFPELQRPDPQELIDQLQKQWTENLSAADHPELPGEMPDPAQWVNHPLPVPKPESKDDASPGTETGEGHAVVDKTFQQAVMDAASIDASDVNCLPGESTASELTGEMTVGRSSETTKSIGVSNTNGASLAWDQQLESTIAAFQAEIENTADETQRTDLSSGLSILQSLRHRLDAKNQDGIFDSPQHREYWDHQIDALSELLEHSAAKADLPGTTGRAVKHLQLAVMNLRDIADLNMAVVAFCTRVEGYGQYVPVRSMEFEPGQTALIYCELENFLPVKETFGDQVIYRTRLLSRFNVLDATDNVVQQADFPVVEDVARNRRRDFYMHVPITIGNLQPGNYRLYLTIEDLGGNKTATLQSPLGFSVR